MELLKKQDSNDKNLIEIINSGNMKNIHKVLISLKETLINCKEVLAFIEKKNSFFALMSLFQKLCLNLTRNASGNLKLSNEKTNESNKNYQIEWTVLNEIISVLSNLCHFSMSACAQIKSISQFGMIIHEILESGEKTDTNIKLNILCLAKNLCNFKETSSAITSCVGLLDKIVLSITNKDLSNQALRVVCLLSKQSTQKKALVLSNTCYFIGIKIIELATITKIEKCSEILQILMNLFSTYPKDVGRQLANSGCMSVLIEFIFQDEASSTKVCCLQKNEQNNTKKLSFFDLWRTLILRLTKHSFDIREVFGSASIKRVVELSSLDKYKCEFLCYFSQDAWSRACLRETGALARLLDINNLPEYETSRQVKVLESLKHFVFDIQSLTYLCQHVNFVQVAIILIKRHLQETHVECNLSFYSGDERANENIKNNKRKYDINLKKINNNYKKKMIKNDEFFVEKNVINNESIEKQTINNSEKLSPTTNILGFEEMKNLPLSNVLFSRALKPFNNAKVSPKYSIYNKYDRQNWSPSMSPTTSSTFDNIFVEMESTLGQVDCYKNCSKTVKSFKNCENEGEVDKFADFSEKERILFDLVFCNEKKVDSLKYTTKADLIIKKKKCVKKETKSDATLRQEVVEDCIDIFSRLTHQEENYSFIIKKEVIETLINYVSDAPKFDHRLVRSIKRLVRCKSTLQKLIELKFHQLIIKKLIRRKCFLSRFAKFCHRCDERREFGCELLTEFSKHVDSNLGWNLMQINLRSENKEIIHNAMIDSLILIRNLERNSKLHYNYLCIETLLCELKQILSTNVLFNFNKCSTSTDENLESDSLSDKGEMCCEIIIAFSSLITRRILNRVFNLNLYFCHHNIGKHCGYELKNLTSGCVIETLHDGTQECIHLKDESFFSSLKTFDSSLCTLEIINGNKLTNSKYENLTFYNASNFEADPILVAPKHKICASSEYFQGMFGNDFIEKIEGRNKFVFNEAEDHCSENDFLKFLHYLCGCRDSSCVEINTAETCAALLYLSDKYLCSTLLNSLIQTNGLAHKLMNGDSLNFFIPLMITCPSIRKALSNTWVFVFLRYTTSIQIISTLNYFNENKIDFLIDILQNFLIGCINGSSLYQNILAIPFFDC